MSKDKIFTSKKPDGKEVEIKFLKPSQKVISRGDFVYREHFGKSVRAGLMTNAEAEKLLKDRNIWNDERESEAIDIQVRINDLEEKFSLDTAIDTNEGLKIYKELKELRSDLLSLTNIRRAIVDNTAEAMAAEMRTQFYASECVVYNHNGQRVFKNLDDFMSKLGEELALDCYRNALIANYETVFGIDLSKADEVDSREAEDKWLDKIQEKEVEKEVEEEKSDELKDSAPPEDKVEEPKVKKKRRSRKKKVTLEK
jgi:hypothetical protein